MTPFFNPDISHLCTETLILNVITAGHKVITLITTLKTLKLYYLYTDINDKFGGSQTLYCTSSGYHSIKFERSLHLLISEN